MRRLHYKYNNFNKYYHLGIENFELILILLPPLSRESVAQSQAGKGDSCALGISQTILTYLVHLFELMSTPFTDGQNILRVCHCDPPTGGVAIP